MRLPPLSRFGRTGVFQQPANALNKYNQFPVCRNNKYTEIMRSDILAFIERHISKVQ